ncbi:MAG: phosphoglycerate dehydrogenase [Deinococcota bacterium]
MKVLLPTTVELNPDAVDGVTYIHYDVQEPIPENHRDAEAVVVWGNPRARLQEMVTDLATLRWVQGLAAGPNSIISAGFGEDVIITSGRSLHDTTVAEHALALMLSAVHKLYAMRDAQLEGRYPKELGGLQPVDPVGNLTSLLGARVLIWGFGSIAKTLAPFLVTLGAKVKGIARSSGERDGFTVHAEAELETHLPNTDILVMILPSTPANHHALSASRLAKLPAHAWVVNVGRGDTVNEVDLAQALHQGQLAGAALDVFETEPLPADSVLWNAPNLIMSPHAAGGRPRGADALIVRNVKAFLASELLENTVDPTKGY